MRIPPFHHDKSWQRFFVGVILGMLIGWLFFLYNFGYVHEKLVMEINKQKSTVENHEKTIDILQKDQDEQNKENQQKLTVQTIKINFTNEKEVNLSELTLFELKEDVESELELVKNKSIETVYSSKELLLKAVRNKIFVIGDKRYQLEVEQLTLYTTLELELSIHAAE
ncbi:sporulation membrane protein YtrI [Alteribacter populi]|uniref:sporulation membrane protein YtrI n=1 Tax=Alteribacter populi TaxID=2011011 RepID=UPI000BBA6588|nr:sporulation membrane protein YtrI [Alteribacter populi]